MNKYTNFINQINENLESSEDLQESAQGTIGKVVSALANDMGKLTLKYKKQMDKRIGVIINYIEKEFGDEPGFLGTHLQYGDRMPFTIGFALGGNYVIRSEPRVYILWDKDASTETKEKAYTVKSKFGGHFGNANVAGRPADALKFKKKIDSYSIIEFRYEAEFKG